MVNAIDRSPVSLQSRRQFLGRSAGTVALVAVTSSGLSAQDVNWRLGVRYITGGAAYRPSFATMFLDPMFLQIDVGPNDLGIANSPTIGTRKATLAAASGARGQGPSSGSPGAAANTGQAAAAPPPAQTRPLSPGVAAAPAPGRPAPGGRGAATYSNAPLNASQVPFDMPIIPSVGVPVGISTLTRAVYSVVALNDQTEWIASSRQAIEDAVNSGDELVGTVVFHHALGDNQSWPLWYREITGGLLVLNNDHGMKKSTITPNASFDMRPVGNHPIVQDLSSFKVTGEDAYKGMWQSPNITPLFEATGPATDRVVAWVGPNPEKGRVVVIQPGTSSETHRNPAFRKLVRNAILWAGYRLE